MTHDLTLPNSKIIHFKSFILRKKLAETKKVWVGSLSETKHLNNQNK